MSIEKTNTSDIIEQEKELTERKLTFPFISEKKIKGHVDRVYDCTFVRFPDGKDRIITCSRDSTLRIFDIEKQKCEKIVEHSEPIYSVHFYEEEEVLMATDWNGELIIWKLFPEIKIFKKIQVAEQYSVLMKITPISSNFFCCVSTGTSVGCLYEIKFNKNKNKNSNNWISKEEIYYPKFNNSNEKEAIMCIYQLISQKNKNLILFAGGKKKDFTIKSVNLNNNKFGIFQRFPLRHSDVVYCITSFINSKNEEIVLSGGNDENIIFWNLKGECTKEVKFKFTVNCFLNDFTRNNIFVGIGAARGWDDDVLYIHSFSLKTENFVRGIKNVHNISIRSMKWLDQKNQNKFVSCSADKTFNIYEMEEIVRNNQDVNETFEFLEEISDCPIKFKNKIIKFWNIFTNEIEITEKEETLRKFENIETVITEDNILSIIQGNKVEIPLDHLPDYFYFFNILNLKHCVTTVIEKIDEIEELEDVYFFFKDFCLKYENEYIKNWFSTDPQTETFETFSTEKFETYFALHLFNKMKIVLWKNEQVECEMVSKVIKSDVFFAQVWIHLRQYKLPRTILKKYNYHEGFEEPYKIIDQDRVMLVSRYVDHKDFDGVMSKEEFFLRLYENRTSTSNLTLISTDKKEFKVHKEIMILQYGFFFLLFRFRGLEVTEYEKTGKITLVDLMSSNVVNCLVSYAYMGSLNVESELISALDTFLKLLIFCDQFNEILLMREVKIEFEECIKSHISEDSTNSNHANKKSDSKSKISEVLSNLFGLSNYLVGNDKVLKIIVPLIAALGVEVRFSGFLYDMILQNSKTKKEKEKVMAEKHENEKRKLREKKENERKDHMKEKERLQKRILELEKLVGEINEENEEGVGKGQIRERENDEDDEEIKKEQPKRKKRKFN